MRPRPWVPLAVGVAAGAIGLVPWLIHGMRLPLQNLWVTAPPEDAWPLVLLPFSQYALSTLASLLVIGGALGGLGGRALRGERTGAQRAPLAAGVLLVQVVALVQTTVVVRAGLPDRPETATYLGLLIAGSLFAMLVGLAVLLLLAAPRRAAVVVGAALAAVLLPSWLGGLLVPPITSVTGPTWILEVPRWLAPIAVGVAVAWSGVRTLGRIAAAVFAALALWIGPPIVTAVTSAAGARVYARLPGEMLGFGLDVFRSALLAPELVIPPLLVAAAIAAVGIVAHGAARRRRPAPEA
ncbi:hypothetical protein [Amnibacterium sp.]|uniref:hypothetical protein n=1 Tax=Amnibacterium sp. TaxID=1872496 RepID=UPI003F7BF839